MVFARGGLFDLQRARSKIPFLVSHQMTFVFVCQEEGAGSKAKCPLPFVLHPLLGPGTGGGAWVPEGRSTELEHRQCWPRSQEPVWFFPSLRDPQLSLLASGPAGRIPAGTQPQLPPQGVWFCHWYYFPPTTPRTNVCSTPPAHI